MTADNEEPTETSALLSQEEPRPEPIASGQSVVSDAGPTYGSIVKHNGSSGSPEDGGNLERQTSAADRQKQYDGMPELKKQMIVVLPALAVGIFLSACDQTLIVSSYGIIGSDLKALNNTSWIATAYFLTLTSFQPLYGKLSDIFGRKPCLLFAYIIFGLGCLFCGLARNMNELIAARAFAGIGGGGMTTVVSILLSDAIPLVERGQWQGYVNVIFAAGASTGAPLGGFLADSIGWRWSFIFQAPLCLIAFIAVAFILKLPRRDDADWKTKLARIDFIGAIILIAAVFTLLLALDRGSNVSWKATITIVSIALSIPLFIVFVVFEAKFASEPFAPGHIIFHRSLFACFLCNFFSFAGWLAALFYIPLYFQAVDGLSATDAGIRLIPSLVCGVSGSLAAGFYMRKTGRYYWLTVGCYSCLVLGMIMILLSSGILTSHLAPLIVGMCICSFSNGIGVTSSLIGLIANAAREDQAVATACSYLFRSLGSVCGVSLSATVANQVLRDSLQSELSSGAAAAEIAERVRRNLKFIGTLEPGVRAIVADCYAKSTRAAFGLQIGLVAGAAISAWFIREKALSK